MSRPDYVLILEGRDAAGAVTKFRYATTGAWQADLPALPTWGDGRLKRIGVFRRGMFGANRLRGPAEVSEGGIVLENVDGSLDVLRGSNFEMEIGALYVFRSFGNILYGGYFAGQPTFDEGEVTVAMRGGRIEFDTNAVAVRYAGTNSGSPLAGVEGVAEDLKGQPKPLVLGKVFNISPPLVNTTKRIYQVTGVQPAAFSNGGQAGGLNIGWTMTVYDKRSALTAGANYTSQADMEATAPGAGLYRVWPAGGCFRVGSAPVGRITCDVYNPVNATAKLSEVAKELLRVMGGTFSTAEEPVVYLASDPDCGIYLPDEINGLEALSQVLESVNGTLVEGRPGAGSSSAVEDRPRLLQLTLPADSVYAAAPGNVSLVLTETDILEGSLREVVSGEQERGQPIWRVKLGYKKNYSVMGTSDLSGVAAADAEFCKREYRYVTAEDATVKTQTPLAGEMELNTLLIDATAAQAEANRLLTMFKVRRDMYQLTVPLEAIRRQPLPNQLRPGWVANITHSRFGLGAGRNFIVVSTQEDLDADEVQLTVWG